MNKTAAVILNYNNYNDTIKCVNNIIDKKAPLDIIIVDNNSPNNSVEILKSKFGNTENCYVIANKKNIGYAAGNNIGIRFASDNLSHIDYICIMNPDTLFDDQSMFYRMEKALSDNKQYAVAAPVMILNDTLDFSHTCWKIPSGFVWSMKQIAFYKSHLDYKITKDLNEIFEVDAVHGSFFMIKLDVLKELGFLDEGTFMYCEETLLALDLKKSGYKEIEMLNERFFHNHNYNNVSNKITLSHRLDKEMKGVLKSRIYVCKKHYAMFWHFFIYITTFVEILYVCLLHLGSLIKRLFSSFK